MLTRICLAMAVLAGTLQFPTPLPAQSAQSMKMDYSRSAGSWPSFAIYRPREIPLEDFRDSPRVDQLIRGGKLYLSLADAIALAIENNLDIATARYGPREADADILRARSGANLSGVQTQIFTLSTAQTGVAVGGGGQAAGPQGQATGITAGATQAAQAAQGAAATGAAASFFGTQSVNLDPSLTAAVNFGRQSNPQISSFVTGTNTRIVDSDFVTIGYQQGFVSGTTVNLSFTTFDQETNELRTNFNPSTTADVTLQIRQRLTQGFGRSINGRNILVGKNNREISDLVFKQQVITTVSQIQNLYWTLVSLIEQVKARRTDLDLSERLLRDNKRQVELGLLAQVEVVRAEAEAATFRQQLVQAEANVRAQEYLVKNAISKRGPSSDVLGPVAIAPTDEIDIPEVEPVEPVQDLIALALQADPSLTQSRIGLTNTEINMRGVKDAMRPSVDVVLFATNNALAGTPNPNVIPSPGTEDPSPFFIGGFGTAVKQLFRRNFPDYGVRFEMNIPLKNRQAQADMTRELLRRRQQDIQLRQAENQVMLNVEQAVNNLQQARKSYDIAYEARILREQMLEAERKRFQLGSSTIFQIVQVQRDLANARTTEISAMSTYLGARVELDRVTSRTLEKNNITVDEAYLGEATKRPDPLPPMALAVEEAEQGSEE